MEVAGRAQGGPERAGRVGGAGVPVSPVGPGLAVAPCVSAGRSRPRLPRKVIETGSRASRCPAPRASVQAYTSATSERSSSAHGSRPEQTVDLRPGSTSLGEDAGGNPTLGEAVLVGAPGRRFWPVEQLGNRVVIGANAVVVHDVHGQLDSGGRIQARVLLDRPNLRDRSRS